MGGGVTSANAMEYLDAGASHVIVTSYVFREGRLEEDHLAELVRVEVCVYVFTTKVSRHHEPSTQVCVCLCVCVSGSSQSRYHESCV
jgi:hypothetical protein